MQQASFFEEFTELINKAPRQRRGQGEKKEKKAPDSTKTRFPIFANPCSGCPLESYKKLLDGKGNLSTCKVIVLVDKVQFQDIITGKALSDQQTLRFFEKAFSSIGIAPEEVAYIYALRCACHDKELKRGEEVKRCGNYLLRDLTQSPCQTIFCTSLTAISYMFGATSLRTYRGKVLEFQGKKVLCAQPPEVVQRDPIQASMFERDIKRLGQLLLGNYTQPKVHYSSLKNSDEIIELCTYLAQQDPNSTILGWDIETMWLAGLKPFAQDAYSKHFRVWHMAFAWDDYCAAGFPFSPDPVLATKYGLPSIDTDPKLFTAVKNLLEKRYIVEHSKTDARNVGAKYGIELAKNLPFQHFDDTLAMHFLINPEDLGGNSLKALAWEFTNEGGYEEGIGWVDKLEDYDWEKGIHYNCHDADLTRRFRYLLPPKMSEMKQDEVYELLLKPINCAVTHMELDGLQMDASFLREQQAKRNEEMEEELLAFKQSSEYNAFVAYCKAKVSELKSLPTPSDKKQEGKTADAVVFYSEPFEVKNEHLAVLLYEVLKLPITKKTEHAEPSTEADVIEAASKKYPSLKHLLIYKKAQKFNSTYINPYIDGTFKKTKNAILDKPPHIKEDGRIHPTIKPTGARTGRSSCENPNGQNIINSYEGRRPFISRFEGGALIIPDYSQAEIRLAATQCKDPLLIKALAFDIHSINLALIENLVTFDEVRMALTGAVEEGESFAKKAKGLLDSEYEARVKHSNPEKHSQWESLIIYYSEQRRTIAKKFMFGGMYGQSVPGVIRQLVQELGVNKADAEQVGPVFAKTLKELYPIYFKWAEANVPTARKVNYVESIFGRRRPLNYAALLNNLTKKDEEIQKQLAGLDRKVTNTKVQGPASDLCLLAAVHLVELFKGIRLTPKKDLKLKLLVAAGQSNLLARCLEKRMLQPEDFMAYVKKVQKGQARTRTLLTVHDSIINDAPNEEILCSAILIDTVLREVPKHYIDTHGVPFKCDVKIGPNWGELRKFVV